MEKVEEIASLLALHGRPRLGAQHFIDVVGAHDGADTLAIVIQGIELTSGYSDALSLRLTSTLMVSSRRRPTGTKR